MSLSARILKEISFGVLSQEFDFIFDSDGIYGEPGSAYLRFSINNGPYNGQVHVLRIKFIYGSNQPYQFPKDPPNVTFETPIFHPNISTGGSICLDVIKPEKWSPLYGIETIFNSIVALLGDPNVSSPFNGEAAREYLKYVPTQFKKYDEICTE
jgi:ubiquitin-protein ligase